MNTTAAGAGLQFGAGSSYAILRSSFDAPPDMPEIPFPTAQIGDVLTTLVITGIKYNQVAQSNMEARSTTPTTTSNTATSTPSAKNISGATSDYNKTNSLRPRNVSSEP